MFQYEHCYNVAQDEVRGIGLLQEWKEGRKNAIKAIDGREWDPVYRMWWLPRCQREKVNCKRAGLP